MKISRLTTMWLGQLSAYNQTIENFSTADELTDQEKAFIISTLASMQSSIGAILRQLED